MAKKTGKAKKDLTVRPPRAKLSAAEIIKRMESLPERAQRFLQERSMAKKPKRRNGALSRKPQRIVLTREEVLKRMKDFPKRKEQFIAALREGKNRGVRS